MALIMFLQLGFIFVSLVRHVQSHGYQVEPASRNSKWRFGFGGEKNFDDNQLFCGGFNVQWYENYGKCGVCGDPFHVKEQPHVFGGKFADGTITKTYSQGQQITVTLKITADHKGYSEFRVGKIGEPPITQDKLTHLLKRTNGEARWPHPKGTGNFAIDLVLPRDLSCDHCVMQWTWTAGNNNGCDDVSGECGLGLGAQETFVNCADIRITPSGEQPPARTAPPVTETDPPVTGTDLSAAQTDSPVTETDPPVTETDPPAAQTDSPVTETDPPAADSFANCKAVGLFSGKEKYDSWCKDNCRLGFCPPLFCKCPP